MQWVTVLICGMCNGTDAVEVLSLSFVLPMFTNEMTIQEQGYLSAAVFLGMLVGAVGAGCLADAHGRRPILIASMVCNGIFTLAFSLSHGLVAMSALRFLTGCGVGGAVPVVFSLASEVRPAFCAATPRLSLTRGCCNKACAVSALCSV